MVRFLLIRALLASSSVLKAFVFGFLSTRTFKNGSIFPRDTYFEMHALAKASVCNDIDIFEVVCGFKVDRAFLDDLGLLTQIVVKKSQPTYEHGRILYSLLRSELEAKANLSTYTVLEIGSARGFSSLCMAKACDDAGMRPNQVKVVSVDILPHNRKMYWGCISDFDGPKTREELLSPWKPLRDRVEYIQLDSPSDLSHLALPTVDFAFVDGNHNYSPVLSELSYITERQVSGGIIVVDDYSIAQYPEIVRAVNDSLLLEAYSHRTVNISSSRTLLIAKKQ